MKMIAVGDNVVDCYLDQGLYYPGGNAVNVAVNCKRYGFDGCSYIGVFGDDDKARHIQRSLEQEGVTFHHSRFVKGISGQPRVRLIDGDRRFVGGPKNTVQHTLKLKLTPEDLDFIAQHEICHTSCYSSIEEELPKIKQSSAISFDFSDYRDRAYLEKVCPHIRFGFFTGSGLNDAQIKELMNLAQELGTEIVGVTIGEKGAVFLKDGVFYKVGTKPITVVDTMGAGDSFIAAFLTSYLKAGDMEQALDEAATRAAEACTFYGAYGYPAPFQTEDD